MFRGASCPRDRVPIQRNRGTTTCRRRVRPPHTGVRFGEAAGVTWDDLELDTNQPIVHIRRSVVLRHVGPTKTGRPRDIPLTPAVVAALRTLERHSAYVFSLRDGDFIVPTTTLSYLHRICRRAAISPISWHGLRHTFATELTSRGVPLRIVQELLGHTTIHMTCRYAHVAPSTMHAAIAVLDHPGDRFGHQVDTKMRIGADEPASRSPADFHLGYTQRKTDP